MASSLTAGAFTGHNNLPIDCRRMPEDSQFKATLKIPVIRSPHGIYQLHTLKLPQSFAGHKGQDRGRVTKAGPVPGKQWTPDLHIQPKKGSGHSLRRHSGWCITLAGGMELASVAGHTLSLGEGTGFQQHRHNMRKNGRGKRKQNPRND